MRGGQDDSVPGGDPERPASSLAFGAGGRPICRRVGAQVDDFNLGRRYPCHLESRGGGTGHREHGAHLPPDQPVPQPGGKRGLRGVVLGEVPRPDPERPPCEQCLECVDPVMGVHMGRADRAEQVTDPVSEAGIPRRPWRRQHMDPGLDSP